MGEPNAISTQSQAALSHLGEGFGKEVPTGRPEHPWEVATAFLPFALAGGSCFTGQSLYPNGGMIVGA